MILKRIFTIAGIAAMFLSFYGCFPTISSSIQNSRSEVVPVEDILILSLNNSAPSTAQLLGQSSFTSSDLNTGCGYEDAIAELKKIASKNGGNVIKITEQKAVSGLMDECVSLKADIYFAENLAELRAAAERESPKPAESVTVQVAEPSTDASAEGKDAAGEAKAAEAEPEKSVAPAAESTSQSGEYATLYIYRPSAFGFAVTYDLHLDEDVLCKVKSVWGQEVKVYKSGKHELWAKTESKVAVPIDIEFGKSYYVECGVGMGLLVGRPTIKLVDEATGKPEFIDVTD